MPEPDDELQRLRAADPVERVSLPSTTDPEARALFERITMTDTDTHTPATRRRTVALAAAAAIVVALVGGAIAITGNGGGKDTADVAAPSTTPEDTGAPITPGGTSTGSCVELYDLQTLANREVAFDGTVQQVEGDQVTFTVNQWYRGNDQSTEVTLAGAETLNGLTSAGPAATLEPGARLLVAGDGGFAWSCGFTQPYDADIAAEWAEVLKG